MADRAGATMNHRHAYIVQEGSNMCVCGVPVDHPVHGSHAAETWSMTGLYLDLKGALERLCRAQTHLPSHWRSDAQQAINIVQEIGSAVCPDTWSKYDQPEYGDAT